MSEQKQILRNSRVMVLMTSISRVFGLVRVQVIAYLLGTSRLGDVWAISFMIPNLFRRLIAEGAMSSAFVPILSELTEQEQEGAARDFIRSIFSLILLASVSLVSVMVLILPQALPWLLKAMNPPGSVIDQEALDMVVLPTQIMFPYLIFISLAAVCQGVLNVNNRFGLPAFTPIVLNISIISCGLLLNDIWENPLWGLCTGVLIGGFFQVFLQWLQLRRMGFRLTPVHNMINKRTREAMRLWAPTTFSGGIVQVNALIGTMIALNVLEGGAIALENSTRLMELILGIFTVALSTSLLPTLAKQRTRQDTKAVSESLFNSIGVLSLITIPASLGLIIAGPELIEYLLKRGRFDDHSLMLTYTALIFHGMALIPISWYRLVIQIFYAYKQVRITVWIAAIGALINISGCLLFPNLFQSSLAHCGVALATLVSSWALFLTAIIICARRFELQWPRKLNKELLKMMVAALAFVPVWLGNPLKTNSFVIFIAKVLASVIIYGILVWLFRVSASRQILRR